MYSLYFREGDKMAPSVEKKIAELEMGLLHLQQNIDIPEISLPVHATVGAIIKKCLEQDRKPKVADFGDRIEDSTFLNQLQNGVNRWIKEIQKVTFINIFLDSFYLSFLGHEVRPRSFFWYCPSRSQLLAQSRESPPQNPGKARES